MIRLLLIPAILLLCINMDAQPVAVSTCKDSLVVRTTTDGSMYLLWKAGPATSVQRMAEATGCSIDDIGRLNPILRFRDLGPCDILMTPFTSDRLHAEPPPQGLAIWYEVKPGETMFSIARRTFRMQEDHLMALNHKIDPAVREGEALLLGWLDTNHGVTLPGDLSTPAMSDTVHTGEHWVHETSPDSLHTEHMMTQKGVAWWNKSKPDPNFFALHRYAPANSYIEIRNPMFGRSVRAKVIGTIPPTYPDDISVIVSEGVARELGAIDTRFYAEMSYAMD